PGAQAGATDLDVRRRSTRWRCGEHDRRHSPGTRWDGLPDTGRLRDSQTAVRGAWRSADARGIPGAATSGTRREARGAASQAAGLYSVAGAGSITTVSALAST